MAIREKIVFRDFIIILSFITYIFIIDIGVKFKIKILVLLKYEKVVKLIKYEPQE